MKFWLVTLLLGSLTFFGRASFILFFSQWEMPAWFKKMLRFVPVAAFSAIITPSILRPEGDVINLSFSNLNLIASLVAIVVAYFSCSIIITIIFGMSTLWLATWLQGG
ncbi:MAG: AzlD domain-containing protein [Candidatus Promineifilaceae bacterium]